MLNFFKRQNKKQEQTQKKIVRYKNRGQYQIVDGFAQFQIPPSSTEMLNEDQILNSGRRGRLLSLTRNLVRNSPLFSTLLFQLETNVIGQNGGKVILNFQDNEINKNLKKYFADFTRNADFYDGRSFRDILGVYMKQLVIGGDLVICFDHFVEGSGKLIYFESDEIVSCSPDVVEKHYGQGSYQSLGKVYSKNGRWIGTIVSRGAKGQENVLEEKCWFLKRNPNGNPLDEYWIQPQTSWRHQTRGISQAAVAVNAATQLEDLVLSELEAARKNAQTFCWIKSQNQEQEEIPSAFAEGTDFSQMTDAQIEEAAKAENEATETVNLQAAHANSIAFQQLPSGYTAELVDTKHPNTNVEVMTQWLAGRIGAVLGLSRAYATGNPTNEDFRAQQLLTAPAILAWQKDLEKICDWTFYNFIKWLENNKTIEKLEDGFMDFVSWDWKRLDSCDEIATEQANQLKLQNMTASYREILGNNWREKLLEVAQEVKWMKENGLCHISEKMISGGQVIESKIETKAEKLIGEE